MKFRIIEKGVVQWATSKTYKSHKSTPAPKEVQSEPVANLANGKDVKNAKTLRFKYFYTGKPLGFEHPHC